MSNRRKCALNDSCRALPQLYILSACRVCAPAAAGRPRHCSIRRAHAPHQQVRAITAALRQPAEGGAENRTSSRPAQGCLTASGRRAPQHHTGSRPARAWRPHGTWQARAAAPHRQLQPRCVELPHGTCEAHAAAPRGAASRHLQGARRRTAPAAVLRRAASRHLVGAYRSTASAAALRGAASQHLVGRAPEPHQQPRLPHGTW